MPLQPPADVPEAIHHVTMRGDDRRPVLRDDTESRAFMELLGATCRTHGLSALAWCLTGNRIHLVLRGGNGSLPAAMHQLTPRFTHRRHNGNRASGQVFQERYHALQVQRDAYLLEVVRYVLLSPVRANLCRTATEWRWSSAREMLGLRSPPDWADFALVYDLLGEGGSHSAARLAVFLEVSADGSPGSRVRCGT